MAKDERQKLVSVSAKDCIRQTFRCGGKGGQNVNKLETGVRFVHQPSGARGEGREHRTQGQNEKAAWERLIATPEFNKWLKIENSRAMGTLVDIEREMEEAMRPENFRVEGKVNGKWVPIEEAIEDA
jgi:protein subunit release factor A